MSFSDFIPPTSLLVTYLLMTEFLFINQTWVSMINRGRIGSLSWVPSAVIMSGFAATLFSLATLVATFWFLGWKMVLGMFFGGIVLTRLLLPIFSRLSANIAFFAQVFSTIAIWPTCFLLSFEILNMLN